MLIKIWLYQLVILCLYVFHSIADSKDWIVETNNIIDRKANPVLANGHIGFTVFDSSVYMNGLYNGKGPQTHRARIENHANFQIDLCNINNRISKKDCKFRFNIRTGIFEVVYEDKDFMIKHQVFPHRFYTRTIVNRFIVERKQSKNDLSIKITNDPGKIGLDMSFPDFSQFTIGRYNVTLETGSTIIVENEKYQKKNQSLTFAYTSLNEINLPLGKNRLENFAFMVIDQSEDVVRKELDRVISDSNMVEKHEKEWIKFWDTFDIEVESRIDLAVKVHGSIYALVSNLPSPNTFEVSRPFYGISSSGLGDVSEDNQLQGRITWDQEMYMLPVVALINPEWSESILNYRYNIHADDPVADGGWNYYWETAFTGQHLDVFRESVKSTHVPADVAFAARYHLSVTNDKKWMEREGCELAINTAKYWAARTGFNVSSDLYDLKGVRSSSKIDDPITNNAFVNVAVGYNLYFGQFASCLCSEKHRELKGNDNDWNTIARSLTLPYDDKQEFVLEHTGYEEYIRTSAADMVLLNHPLQYPLSKKVKKNTLDHYKKLQIRNSPPTTWAMHIIGDLDVQNYKEESSLFLDISYYYMERPFHVWTDRVSSDNRVYNFVSGAAAYIQIFMNGYAGIRIHFDRMEIKKTRLPPHSTKLKVKGVKYLSATFEFVITDRKYIVTMTDKPTNDIELIGTVVDGGTYKFQKAGDTIETSSNSTIIIKAKTYPYGECRMPNNIIGIPKSENSLLPLKVRARANASRIIIGCLLFAFVAVLCAFLFIMYKRHGTVFPSSAIRYVRNV